MLEWPGILKTFHNFFSLSFLVKKRGTETSERKRGEEKKKEGREREKYEPARHSLHIFI